MEKTLTFGLAIIFLSLSLTNCGISYNQAEELTCMIIENEGEHIDFLISINSDIEKEELNKTLDKIETRLRKIRDVLIEDRAMLRATNEFAEERKERMIEPINKAIEKIDKYLAQK